MAGAHRVPAFRKGTVMASFGVFGRDRWEVLEALAWRWLLRDVGDMKAADLQPENLHRRYAALQRIEEQPWGDHCREFWHDLVEAALHMPSRHEEGSTVRLADEVRNRISFQILTGMFYEKGLSVGDSLPELILEMADHLAAPEKDVKDLVKMMLRDLTALALKGD